MYGAICTFNKQFLFRPTVNSTISPSIHRIFYAGMGGSVIPADLANDYLYGEFDLCIIRNYTFPGIGNTDFVLFASYSGNTEETIAAFQDGLKKRVNAIVLTHGGKLKSLAVENKIPVLHIPECIQPRCASGYFFSAILAVLEKIGIIEGQKKILTDLSAFLKSRQSIHEKEGKKLAGVLKGRVPVVYGPHELEGTCRFWKIKFNENSKIPAFFNVFPELNHNEMVGWTQCSTMNPYFIFLRSQFMHPRVAKRMDVMKSLFKGKIPVYDLQLEGENRLQEMFDSLAIADYASTYLAMDYGVDPVKVDMVENFKKSLG